MLDLLISYINFLILSISYIVKKFTFLPPNPPKYIIVNDTENQKEDIHFLLNLKKSQYKKIKLKYLKIEYSKIINDNQSLPILKLTPLFHFSLCIIYCQGNCGDLGASLFECFEISYNCNCIILTFEYPGYGICKNDEIIQEEFFRRIKMVYSYAINRLHFKPNQIIVYGFSLGTGIAFDFACKKEYPIAGLILQSPFLSILRTIYNIKKTKYFDLFNNCDKAKYLCRKTLFIHGNHDSIVPYIHGRILAELIPKEYFYGFLTVKNADHNNLIKYNKKIVFKSINQFIKDCTKYYNDRFEEIYDISSSYDTNEDKDITKKVNNISSIEVSENIGINKTEEGRNSISSFDNEQNNEYYKKPNSYINCTIFKSLGYYNVQKNDIHNSLYNRLFKKSDNKIINNKKTELNYSSNKVENISKNKNNNNIRKKILKYNNNNITIRNNIINNNNNYCSVNNGISKKNNNHPLYKKLYNDSNENMNIIKKLTNENSMATINTSTNNNSYSKE